MGGCQFFMLFSVGGVGMRGRGVRHCWRNAGHFMVGVWGWGVMLCYMPGGIVRYNAIAMATINAMAMASAINSFIMVWLPCCGL